MAISNGKTHRSGGSNFCFRLLVLVTMLGMVGCGGDLLELAPVRGEVTINGAPLTSGTIMFYPEQGRPAQAEIQPDGTFQLTTYTAADGALVGSHRVTVDARQVVDSGNATPIDDDYLPPITSSARLIWLAPPVYADLATSPLRVTVERGENDIDLKLANTSVTATH